MTKHGLFIRIGIILIWVVVTVLYLRYEAYPLWFTRTVPGYRGMLPDDLLARESWAQIRIEGQPAGFVHTMFTMDDDQPEPILEITTRVHIRARILQSTQHIQIFSEIHLNQDYDPQFFTVSASAGDFSLRVTGEHTGDEQFAVTTVSGGNTITRTMVLPRDAVLYSPMQEMAIQQLRPGRSVAIRTLDPLTLQPATIMITAGPRETIEMDGRTVRALPLQFTWQGLALRSWVDENGMMLRQETPLGWIMESTNAETALQAISDTGPAPPLLRGMAGLSLLQTLIGTSVDQR